MKFIDFKQTIWERFEVEDKYVADIQAKIKSGEIKNGNCLYDYFDSRGLGVENHRIDATEGYMSIEDNGGENTIEIIDFLSSNIIFGNAKHEKIKKYLAKL